MAALADMKCAECGSRHQFCYPDADFFSEDSKYEYVCPKTANTSLINGPSEWNEVISGCPKDSVIVSEIGLQHP
jgi:hypothetical protein